jgi:predicted metal-dependent hydrolase
MTRGHAPFGQDPSYERKRTDRIQKETQSDGLFGVIFMSGFRTATSKGHDVKRKTLAASKCDSHRHTHARGTKDWEKIADWDRDECAYNFKNRWCTFHTRVLVLLRSGVKRAYVRFCASCKWTKCHYEFDLRLLLMPILLCMNRRRPFGN